MPKIIKSFITLIFILSLGLAVEITSHPHAKTDPYYLNDTVRVKTNVNRVRKVRFNNDLGKFTPLKLTPGTKLTVIGTDRQDYLFANVTQPRSYVYGIPIKDCSGSYAKSIKTDEQLANRRTVDAYIYHPSYNHQYGQYRNGSDHHYAKQVGLIRHQTLVDLNHDRRNHRTRPLQEDRRDLDEIASVRAHQIYRRQSHYDRHGRAIIFNDAKRLKLNTYASGEAEGENFAVDHVKNHDNGKKIANRNNNLFMYHDWKPFGHLERNSHRHNILNRRFKYVGIGVYLHDRNVIIVEEFES